VVVVVVVVVVDLIVFESFDGDSNCSGWFFYFLYKQ
jgi:hypothetical protein